MIEWDTSAANDANFLTEHSYLKKKTYQNVGYYKLVRERRCNSHEDSAGQYYGPKIKNAVTLVKTAQDNTMGLT